MLYRPERYEEYVGNSDLVNMMRKRISSGTYPQFTIIHGTEGIGKTTLVKLNAIALNYSSTNASSYECKLCKEAIEQVIRKNKDIANIKTFKMSVDGSKEVVKEVIQNFNTNFCDNNIKVIILEECHRMPSEAQDALLTDIEYLPKGVYVMAVTTDLSKMQPTFLSRAVIYKLMPLGDNEIINLMREECRRRELVVQGGDVTLNMIASWAENKPRTALNVLESMGTNTEATLKDIKTLISFIDIADVVELIKSLKGSVIQGLNAINNFTFDNSTHNTLSDILIEAVKLSRGKSSNKLSSEDLIALKEIIDPSDYVMLCNFLYKVASITRFDKRSLISAFLAVHKDLEMLTTPNSNIINEELMTKNAFQKDVSIGNSQEKHDIPTISNLLSKGRIIK